MARGRKLSPDRISRALGATRSVHIARRTLQGPLDWVSVGKDLEARLSSTGGRPTNPDWDIQRLVPLSSKTWDKLKCAAKKIGTHGKRLSPAQLASALLEKALEQIRA